MDYSQLRALFLRRFNIPKEKVMKRAIRSFTAAEKTVFYFFVGIFIIASLLLVWRVNASYLVEVPTRGGTLVEGVVGNPRFINPVLAISEADKNLSTLVYSGLVRIDSEGQAVNDLAESVSVSADGLYYSVKIKDGAVFHDGEPVTTEDVIFTVQKIADPMIKSPRRGNWDGVSLEKVDDKTLNFHLKRPYAPFIENLSVGILPKHIWKNVTDEEFAFSQFNTLPVGSGPYKVVSVERNSGGIPNHYELEPFARDAVRAPYVGRLVFKFYPSEQLLFSAYNDGDIESVSGISPERARELASSKALVVSSPLPRVFAVFFNQNQSELFRNKEVRQALNLSAPKEDIVADVLKGYGTPIEGPLPPGLYPWTGQSPEASHEERLVEAREILASRGWIANEETGVLEKKSGSNTIRLSFSISTGDAPELKAVAEKLVAAWRELGAEIELQVYETGDLNQNVIRPRKFDALLFGEVVGRDADVYPFWHSSQRNDPGLNIALYANAKVDSLLEDARATSDPKKREASYKAFETEVLADVPAVFLYSPSFLYVVPEKVQNVAIGKLATPQDRFQGVRNWYIETDKIWEIFNK